MQNIVQIKGLSVAFNNRKVLSNLELEIQHGMKVVITGPNGSGKTTLFKSILGLIKPQSGNISIKTANIAYCKQDLPEKAFPISAWEVVEMGVKKTDSDKIREAMNLTGTLKFANRSFFNLSGGERQRISLARCIYQNAELILLDEPSSFLDEESKNTILNVLKSQPDDTAVIAISHDENFIKALSWPVFDIRELQK